MSYPLGPHFSNKGPPLSHNRSHQLHPRGRANKMGTYVISVRLGHEILDAIDAAGKPSKNAADAGAPETMGAICPALGSNSTIAVTAGNIRKLERLGLMVNREGMSGVGVDGLLLSSAATNSAAQPYQGSPAKAIRRSTLGSNASEQSRGVVSTATRRSGFHHPPVEPDVGSYAALSAALQTIQVRVPSDATADTTVRLVLTAAGYYPESSDGTDTDMLMIDSQEQLNPLTLTNGPPPRRPAEDFVLQQAFADYTPDFTTEPLSGSLGPIRPALKFPYYLILSLNTFVRQRDRLQYELEVSGRRLIEREYHIFKAFAQGYGEILNDLSRIHASLLESASKALAAKKYQERTRFFTLSRYMIQMAEDRNRMAVRAKEQAEWERIWGTSDFLVRHDRAATNLFNEYKEGVMGMYDVFRRQRFHMNLLAELRLRLTATFAEREVLFQSCLAQMRGIYTTSRLREQFNAAKACRAVVSSGFDETVIAMIESVTSKVPTSANAPLQQKQQKQQQQYIGDEEEEDEEILAETINLSAINQQALEMLATEEIEFEMDEQDFVSLRIANGYTRNPELYEGRPSCVNPLTIQGDVFTSSRSLIGGVRVGGESDGSREASAASLLRVLNSNVTESTNNVTMPPSSSPSSWVEQVSNSWHSKHDNNGTHTTSM